MLSVIKVDYLGWCQVKVLLVEELNVNLNVIVCIIVGFLEFLFKHISCVKY